MIHTEWDSFVCKLNAYIEDAFMNWNDPTYTVDLPMSLKEVQNELLEKNSIEDFSPELQRVAHQFIAYYKERHRKRTKQEILALTRSNDIGTALLSNRDIWDADLNEHWRMAHKRETLMHYGSEFVLSDPCRRTFPILLKKKRQEQKKKK